MAEVRISLPDEQLKQYRKLHIEEEKHSEALAKASAQLDSELRQRRSKFITRHEIQQLASDTPVYRSLGKAFIKGTVQDTVESLRNELGTSDKRIQQIKMQGVYVVLQRDQVRKQIGELIQPYMKK